MQAKQATYDSVTANVLQSLRSVFHTDQIPMKNKVFYPIQAQLQKTALISLRTRAGIIAETLQLEPDAIYPLIGTTKPIFDKVAAFYNNPADKDLGESIRKDQAEYNKTIDSDTPVSRALLSVIGTVQPPTFKDRSPGF